MPMSLTDQEFYKKRTSAIQRQANALEKLADAQMLIALATVADMKPEDTKWEKDFVKEVMKRINKILGIM